jgi:hypothetical protein
MGLDDLIRARALASRQPPTMAPQLEGLLPFPQGLAQRGAVWELPNWGDEMAPGTIPTADPLRGLSAPYRLPGVFGTLGSVGGGIGLDALGGGAGGAPLAPVGAGGGGGDYSTSPGFSASPPGKDFGGYDITPENMISRQGLTGVPEAVKTLLAAERRLNVPTLSEAVSGEGYRSGEQQAALYASHLAGTHPSPVAPPGQSYHEQGEAFDISADWLAANPQVRPWLEQHGFVWDVPGEPWHAHYVGGGEPLRAAIRAFSPSPARSRRRSPSPSRPPAPSISARRRRRGGSSAYVGSAQQR